MKMNRIVAFIAIAAMVLSLFGTPCNAQNVELVSPDRLEELKNKNVLPVAEQQPEFPGGLKEFMAYCKKEIRYPEKCKAAGIEGRAIISFVVTRKGKIKDVEIQKSSGNKLLDKEAVRVIKKMPRWTPGRNKGEAVNVMYTLPVNFKLNKPALKVNKSDNDYTFVHYDTQPEYPGGMKAFTEYIKLNKRYPDECVKNRIEGRAFVRFCIDTIGNVGAVEIMKSSGNKLLDEEALRLMKGTPEKWYPAKQSFEDGKCRPRECFFVMPITFNLGNDDNHNYNDEIVKRVREFCSKIESMAAAGEINREILFIGYFSERFQETVAEAYAWEEGRCEFFFNLRHLLRLQGGDEPLFSIEDIGEEYVNMYGQRRAMVKMCMCDVVSGIHVKHKYAMHLLFENENWVIDDFQDYDEPSDVEMMRLNLERCKDCGKE